MMLIHQNLRVLKDFINQIRQLVEYQSKVKSKVDRWDASVVLLELNHLPCSHSPLKINMKQP